MHIVITDSGVGGLSVCAAAERHFRIHPPDEPVQLTYVNASPENDFGYNAMGSTQEKLEHFDRFLHIITDRFAPGQIYIACNTLSVLLQDTEFFSSAGFPVRGIVETGVHRMVRDLEKRPDSAAIIFGTPTTIDAGTYPKLLETAGISRDRIISQSCPGLADTISEDRQGITARAQITHFVHHAVDTMAGAHPSCLALLACTHYGYRKDFFADALAAAGVDGEILNPNEFVVEDVFGSAQPGPPNPARGTTPKVEFITRYRIPTTALETITHFLEGVSPETVRAFRNYTHIPDLF